MARQPDRRGAARVARRVVSPGGQPMAEMPVIASPRTGRWISLVQCEQHRVVGGHRHLHELALRQLEPCDRVPDPDAIVALVERRLVTGPSGTDDAEQNPEAGLTVGARNPRMQSSGRAHTSATSAMRPLVITATRRGSRSRFCSSEPYVRVGNMTSEPCTDAKLRAPLSPALGSVQARPHDIALMSAHRYPSRWIPGRPRSPTSNHSVTFGVMLSATESADRAAQQAFLVVEQRVDLEEVPGVPRGLRPRVRVDGVRAHRVGRNCRRPDGGPMGLPLSRI